MGNNKSVHGHKLTQVQEEEYFGHYGSHVIHAKRSGRTNLTRSTSKNSLNSLVYRSAHPSTSKYNSPASNGAKPVISSPSDLEIDSFMEYEDQFEYLNDYINTHPDILTLGKQDSMDNCTLVINQSKGSNNESDKFFKDKTDISTNSSISSLGYGQPSAKKCLIEDSYDGVTKNDGCRLIYSTIHIPDGSTHQGHWLNGLQHGLGSEKWADGATYHGEYLHGKKHGFGQFYWPNGNSYVGRFVDGQINGIGTFIWNQGKRYTGEWKDNQMHGHGEYVWPDGRIYRGEFINGKRHGVGLFEWGDGRKYQGGFKNGTQHGMGIYFNTKGIVQHGIWNNGKNTKWLDPHNTTTIDKSDIRTKGDNDKINLPINIHNPPDSIKGKDPCLNDGKHEADEDYERVFK
ncbi:MORN repeat [Babesia microti strain RI]|uniref:MORN repeat n=1 Tax=Babesia microti (strain RI) TaxID=1133968 RepID=A0A1R4AAM0_BABMR|nr:MORN repeat [Babesia microti strain RI]SJK86043.1 MORN repeat [Babesia microti strain RI]|eukprot:XP_021338240.1 MORN repeat [Babesia microti strain RI]